MNVWFTKQNNNMLKTTNDNNGVIYTKSSAIYVPNIATCDVIIMLLIAILISLCD